MENQQAILDGLREEFSTCKVAVQNGKFLAVKGRNGFSCFVDELDTMQIHAVGYKIPMGCGPKDTVKLEVPPIDLRDPDGLDKLIVAAKLWLNGEESDVFVGESKKVINSEIPTPTDQWGYPG